MPGPPPFPKNITVLRGGRRAPGTAPTDKQPDLPVKIPLAPDGLSAAEIDTFTNMARRLAGMRVMSEVDVEALVIYSRNWVLATEAQQRVRESSQIIKSPSGYPIKNPWCNIQRDAEDRCMRILEQFGCTPAGRTRVSKL